jgi:hypothetical protein
MPDDAVCVDCQGAKQEAQAKAAAPQSADDGLRLGDCAPLYREWADCVEREAGQAKACAAVLKEFRACHQQRLVPEQKRR